MAVGACAKRLEGDVDGGRRPADIVNDSSLQIGRLDVAAEADPDVRDELRGRGRRPHAALNPPDRHPERPFRHRAEHGIARGLVLLRLDPPHRSDGAAQLVERAAAARECGVPGRRRAR